MKKRNLLIELLTDESGSFSSKRVIAISCAAALIAMCFISCFRAVTITETLVGGLVTFGCVAMGSSTVDKFSKKAVIDATAAADQAKVDNGKPESEI